MAGVRAPQPMSLAAWAGCCVGLTLVLVFGGLVVGTSSVAVSLDWLQDGSAQSAVVIYDIRLPRTLGAWLAGALLGLAGAIAQGVFRNPLAEPYLLGTASGAALGVTLSLVGLDTAIGSLAFGGRVGLTAAATIGAGFATALTLALSRGVVQTSRLLLSGIVVGFVLSAVTTLILLARPDTWRMMQVFLLGSTGFLGWSSDELLAAILLLCLVPALLLARGLDALSLGDDTAASLGLSLTNLRLALLAVMSVATAAVVGQVGVVGFVGLVAPHLVRETLRVNHRQLLLAAPLCGGALVQAADLLSRWVIRPAELPVGAVMACVGGSYLVLLLWRRSRDG